MGDSIVEQIRVAVRGFTGLLLVIIIGSVVYSLYVWATVDHFALHMFASNVIKNNGWTDYALAISAIILFIISSPRKAAPILPAAATPKPATPHTAEIAPTPPEDPEIVKARKLAEIEMEKAEHMARLRIAEAKGLAGVAAEVAQSEEERQQRQLEELKKL